MSKECRYIDHEYLCERGELDTEIAYLRAEVERLKQPNYIKGPCPAHGLNFTLCRDCVDITTRAIERERDEALARIKTLEATLNNIPCSGPTGCEALAQVAVLLKTLQHIIQYGCERDADYCQIEASKAHAEARALLDRLQRAEAVVTEMKQLLCEAAYLIQFQHDSDAAAQGWTDRYREEKAAWDAGKETT